MPPADPARLPTRLAEWERLKQHQAALSRQISLRTLLSSPARFHDLSLTVEGALFDFSKHLVTEESLALLLDLARERGLPAARDSMFSGGHVNATENRAALHTALRAPADSAITVDGENVIPYIQGVLDKMSKFSERIRSGEQTGYTGKKFTDVVNIGIGGSDLGPRFVTGALQHYHGTLRFHFVSNVDGAAISSVLSQINPETTLFVVASKTFTTEETMLNANVAKQWFVAKTEQAAAVAHHFVALSTNEKEVAAFGIDPLNIFQFRDWVGGRYSVWSAIGLSVMLAVGADNFRKMLAGARAMDEHFLQAPLAKNVPVLMGLLGVWYRNFWDYPAHLLLPYDDRLRMLAKYIQQMDMESNGKSVDKDSQTVSYETGPFIFGEPGTDNQHSFMQLVHQGTTPIPADFIVCAKPNHPLYDNHWSLLSNCLAQSRALAVGQTLPEAGGDPFRVFSGNRPSTTIILPELNPFTLGMLIAAYEHKVFVQGVIWNINSFDQPGVELGKKIAKIIRSQDNGHADLDASTNGLLGFLNKQK